MIVNIYIDATQNNQTFFWKTDFNQVQTLPNSLLYSSKLFNDVVGTLLVNLTNFSPLESYNISNKNI